MPKGVGLEGGGALEDEAALYRPTRAKGRKVVVRSGTPWER